MVDESVTLIIKTPPVLETRSANHSPTDALHGNAHPCVNKYYLPA